MFASVTSKARRPPRRAACAPSCWLAPPPMRMAEGTLNCAFMSPSLLSHVTRVPTAEHDFLARVEINALHPLHMQIAEERFTPPREWKERHRRGDADIDT